MAPVTLICADTASHCISDLSQLEAALEDTPLASWDALMQADATSTFNQSRLWCLAWYRSYMDRFRPLVLFVSHDSTLVGIVPLAVEEATGRLTFAGDNLSDYRDIVALEGYRELLTAELLRLYRRHRFSHPLLIGPTHPDSPTVGTVLAMSGRSARVWSIPQSQPRWCLRFNGSTSVEKLLKKESVRRHLAYYRRQGLVYVEHVTTQEAWTRLRNVFFQHHSLRQVHAGRRVSFTDERKRAFFDALFRECPSSVHFSVLKVGEKVIAEHYGFVWRNILHWGAPAFDISETKHSPGQLLLALLLTGAMKAGFHGMDFTPGAEEFKARFGNECVMLSSLEIYSRRWEYYARRCRDSMVASLKAGVLCLAGQAAWNQLGEWRKRLWAV